MSPWRALARGLRALTRRSAVDRDVDDEVQHYLAEATAAHVARGLAPNEALRAARLELGGVTSVREQVRGSGWETAIETLLADLRYAARRLRAAPGFTAITVLTLAVGLGATTAIFSAVNPILFRSLPYPHPARITTISDVGTGGSQVDVTFGTYRELTERSRSFTDIAVTKPWQPTMIGEAEPERLNGQRVSAGYFRVLGVLPVLGRDFQPSDDVFQGPRVVVLSDALWRRRLGGDSTIVGREIKLDDNNYLVIGIIPGGFENVLAPSAELWAPLQYNTILEPQSREWGHHLRMIARLSPNVRIDGARHELNLIARTPLAEFPRVPWSNLDQGLLVHSLQDEVTRGVKGALLAVLGAVMLVLTIACVNVTNLLLARGAQRRGEFAVRTALGAGRSRLLRQLLTESLLLAFIGGGLGIAVAGLGVRGLVMLSPPGLPRVGAIRVDTAVFAFALGLTTLIGLIVGAIPALQSSREDLRVGLQESSRRTIGQHQATRRTLVVAEVALALVLLVGAGLLLRSLQRLFAVSVGFDTSHLLTMQVQTSGHRFDSDTSLYQFYVEALDQVRRIPGVTSAALTSQLPLSGDFDNYGVHFERFHDSKDDGSSLRYAVTPGYFAAMRIPLRRGRLLDDRDVAGAPRAAVINESFARRDFGGQDPIGQRFHFGPEDGQWYTIVGVVGDVRQVSLALGVAEEIYITPVQWQWVDNVMSFVIRTRGDPAALAPAARQAVWSVDKDQPIVRVTTMDRLVAATAAERRFALTLFEAFALAALVLAAAGIYGVLAGSVAERTREIGVRAALGASRADILRMVVRQGMTLTGLGVAIGVSGAAAATQAIVAMLFGVSRLDAVTYVGVIVLLAGVSLAACAVPAWRAARVDPASTLRTE